MSYFNKDKINLIFPFFMRKIGVVLMIWAVFMIVLFSSAVGSSHVKKHELNFFIVSKNGFITNERGNIVYVCKGDPEHNIDRYLFDLTLTNGTYTFFNIDKSDTISFAIDNTGAYKLGFYEDHNSLTVFKDNPFK